MGAARFAGLIPAAIVLGFQAQSGNLAGFSIRADGDKRKVRARGVKRFSRLRVFGVDSHSNFHRSLRDEINAGLQIDDPTLVDGSDEIQMIDAGRDDFAGRMTLGADRGGDIDPGHDRSAENGTERVGIAR